MMGPIAAVESVIFKSFSVKGRATRAEYWWWALIQFVVLTGSTALDVARMSGLEAQPLNPLAYSTAILALLMMAPNITVTIRRLHDSGRSGFWQMVVMIPIAGPLWFLFMMVLGSDRDENIYGPPWQKQGTWKGKKEGKRNPMQAYAILDHLHDTPSDDVIAARKQEIRDYYRSRVMQPRQT